MSRPLVFTLAFGLVVACRPAAPTSAPGGAPGPLVSTGERSGWLKTGRYDEVITLCRDFAATYAGVTCDEIGRTLQHRPLLALAITRAPGKPTLYIQAGIHAGEIEGKDAGFWFLRDLLDGKVAPGALAAINVVFVPVVNPDGHERFGPNNRPNQRGPEAMGMRTNASRMNLNRDFAKADSPEIAAVLGVIRATNPLALVDLHTTDGAKFEHDIAVMVGPFASRPDGLDELARTVETQVSNRLTKLGHLPLAFYPAFEVDDDPTSGFSIGEPPPRFSQSYAPTRSRLGILVETHSWRTYKERAQSTYHVLQALLERLKTDAVAWHATITAAERSDQALRGRDLPIEWINGPHTTQLAFRGYAYERRTSDISGAPWIIYDETRPQIWNIPLRDELLPSLSVRIPGEGYIIDGGFAALLTPLLDRHGIRYTRITAAQKVGVETFRATTVAFDPPYEGRTRTKVTGAWARETRALDDGAVFVTLRQRNLRLIVQLLDPAGPDSVTRWGLLNSVFEKKEYMEAYVTEQVAREQLAKDPTLRARFDAEVAADPAIANNPAARLEWFYRRHPSWDERHNLLPIYRADREPQLAR
jgi:Zinc carboxypeptidase